MESSATKVNLEAAQQMLNDGVPVLRIAFDQEVSPQRLYQLINEGKLVRTKAQNT